MGCPCCKKKEPPRDEAYINLPVGPVTLHYDNESGANAAVDEAFKEKVKETYNQVEGDVNKAFNDADAYVKGK